MALTERLAMYRELEESRSRPLVVYVTSSRSGELGSGRMAGDAVGELLLQLQALPRPTEALDLLIVSQGGDPTVAWRIVSLVRERVGKFSVLVPQAAFSAATLIALGADDIVMHPHANLGPVDPQIIGTQEREGQAPIKVSFGAEDLTAFLEFCRTRVGLTEQEHVLKAFLAFVSQVGAVPIGIAARGSQMSVSMGEKLLLLHMKGDAATQKARAIAEALNKQFLHHGYPVSRSEAKEVGLKVTYPDEKLETLLWKIWLDIEEELEIREPFNPLSLVHQNPDCAPVFAPAVQLQMPSNLPPPVMQQVLQAALNQIGTVAVPPTPFEAIGAIIESARTATRYVFDGKILAVRLPNLEIQLSVQVLRACWRTVSVVA
jgi:hypothetical protein